MEQKQLQSNLFKSCRLPGCTICRVNEGRNIKGLLFLFSPSSQSEQKHCTGHSLVVIRLSLNNERLQFYRVFVTGNFSLWTQELFCPNETQKSEKGTSVADVLWSNIHTWIELLQLAWWKTNIQLCSFRSEVETAAFTNTSLSGVCNRMLLVFFL